MLSEKNFGRLDKTCYQKKFWETRQNMLSEKILGDWAKHVIRKSFGRLGKTCYQKKNLGD
jgi:hypothetical protein